VASLPEVVTFRSGDGWHLDADLYRPPAARSSSTVPAIVVVHGGAWQCGDKGENVAWSRWLASRGYLVLDIQYRLAPHASWRDAVGDIRSALDWLRAHASELNLDGDRVVLLGRSAGGHLALLTAYGDIFLEERRSPAAVVALYPATDLARLYADAHGTSAGDVRQGLLALLGAAPSAIPDIYAAASPLQLVQPGVPPTLLIHGASDELVPFEQSQLLGHSLEQQGLAVQVLRVPNARHAFDLVSDSPAEQLARSVVLDFLEKRLPSRPARG
jgi:acetyl esterase/lipase